jgi:hypothetical protein
MRIDRFEKRRKVRDTETRRGEWGTVFSSAESHDVAAVVLSLPLPPEVEEEGRGVGGRGSA